MGSSRSPRPRPRAGLGAPLEPVPKTHPRYPIHRVFQAAFVSRIRSGRWPAEAEDMAKVMDVVGGPYYGISGAEIWHNARCMDHVAEAKVPLLVLHPVDDQIIKVEHAEMLRDAAAGNGSSRCGSCPPELTARSGDRLQVHLQRLPRLLRALGPLCRALRRGQWQVARGGSPLRTPGSARRRASGRDREKTDLGGLAGGDGSAGDRGGAPPLRGDLSPGLQRGASA